MNDCLFCKIVAGTIPAYKVYEDDQFLAFLDVNPVSPGHTLVIPKKHSSNFLAMNDELIQEMTPLIKKIANNIKKAVKSDGINIISNNEKVAGQIIFHTHIHIIPRFENDGLKNFPNQQASGKDLKETLSQIKKFI